jgi:hypothetical protein
MMQVNKVNYRKEFFRVDLAHIRKEIKKLGITAHWTMTAEAAEYHETMAIEKAIASDPATKERWIPDSDQFGHRFQSIRTVIRDIRTVVGA